MMPEVGDRSDVRMGRPVTATPYGKCPVCGRNVALRLDGTLRAHQATAGTRNAPSPPRCTGSNREPVSVATS